MEVLCRKKKTYYKLKAYKESSDTERERGRERGRDRQTDRQTDHARTRARTHMESQGSFHRV